MRDPRNLSGVYFRYQNPETQKWENWCFEDLPRDERERQIEDRDVEWLKSLVNHLADTIVRVGDQFDLAIEE